MARLIATFEDRVEVDRPAANVFAQVSDLEALFAALRDRAGVEAKRLHGAGPTAVGDRWRVKGIGRFKRRKGVVEVSVLEPPSFMVIRGESSGYTSGTEITVTPLDAERCTLQVRSAVHASGMRAIVASAALYGTACTVPRPACTCRMDSACCSVSASRPMQ